MKEQRAAVIAAARTYVGTPYHHEGQLRGVGVDCATLLMLAFTEAGVRPPITLGAYSPQWHLHQSEPLYEKILLANGCRVIGAPGLADIVLYKESRMRRHREFAHGHGAIITGLSPLRIVHAFAPAGVVLEGFETEFGQIVGAEKKYFTAW